MGNLRQIKQEYDLNRRAMTKVSEFEGKYDIDVSTSSLPAVEITFRDKDTDAWMGTVNLQPNWDRMSVAGPLGRKDAKPSKKAVDDIPRILRQLGL